MQRIIIESKVLDGIPMNEYYLENYDLKGLVFVQHGYQSNKNRGTDFMSICLARLGYKVVSIDAYKHGERIEEPYISMKNYKRYAAVFNVVTKTAKDIIFIHDKYYSSKFEKYDFIGISMGGMIAFYLSTVTDKINKIVPAIGTPNFLGMTRHVVDIDDKEKYNQIVKNNLEFINQIDPIQHVENMKYSKMFILNTTKDEIVPGKFSEKFYDEFKNERMKFAYYEDVHNVNRQMTNDILSFICDKEVSI
ncbi:MAG: alpha/beta hydrolase [Firmicutes bacterium]|nr:alpha/beta hydrolase [Bacillota bacterium]